MFTLKIDKVMVLPIVFAVLFIALGIFFLIRSQRKKEMRKPK